jgi:hypothetical protein
MSFEQEPATRRSGLYRSARFYWAMFQRLEGRIKQLCAKALSTPESAELPRSLAKSIPSACRHLMFQGPRNGLTSPNELCQ